MNKPYTYLIGWTSINKWYYGVRYSKDCHPTDLWKTYFTSSDVVSEYRKVYGEPDVIQVRKSFNCAKKALIWEYNVLSKMQVLHDDKWLNRAIGNKTAVKTGFDNPFYGKKHTYESRLKMSATKKRNNIRKKLIDINNGVRNATIYAHQLSTYEKLGWVRGRKIESLQEKIWRETIKTKSEI